MTKAQKEERVDLLGLLLQKALSTPHTNKTEYIQNLEHLKAVKIYRKATKKVINWFKNIQKAAVKDYLAALALDEKFDENKKYTAILGIREIELGLNYYEEENNIVNDLLDEFKAYLWIGGHTIDTYILGRNRTQEDLHDFRQIES